MSGKYITLPMSQNHESWVYGKLNTADEFTLGLKDNKGNKPVFASLSPAETFALMQMCMAALKRMNANMVREEGEL